MQLSITTTTPEREQLDLDLYLAAKGITEDPQQPAVDMPKPRIRVEAIAERMNLIHLSNAIAYVVKLLKRPGKGGRRARVLNAYLGFNSEAAALCLAEELREEFGAYCVVRTSKRLIGWTWEVKVSAEDENLERIAHRYAIAEFEQVTERDVAQAEIEQELEAQATARAEASGLPILPSALTVPKYVPAGLEGLGFCWSQRHYATVFDTTDPKKPELLGKIIALRGLWGWKNRNGARSSWDCKDWRDAAIALRQNYSKPLGVSIA